MKLTKLLLQYIKFFEDYNKQYRSYKSFIPSFSAHQDKKIAVLVLSEMIRLQLFGHQKFYRTYNNQLGYSCMTTQDFQAIVSNHPFFDNKSQTSTDSDQLDFLQVNLSSSRYVPIAKNNCSKIKSSLCKNYLQKGYCPYGERCQFAHGPEELKINLDHNRSYKTKDCYSFSKKGYCSFGNGCNFIHERSPKQEQQKQKWSIIYSNHRQTLKSNEYSNSRLLKLLLLE